MELNIIPHEGVGPIRFGMTPDEVRRAVGKRFNTVYEDTYFWKGHHLFRGSEARRREVVTARKGYQRPINVRQLQLAGSESVSILAKELEKPEAGKPLVRLDEEWEADGRWPSGLSKAAVSPARSATATRLAEALHPNSSAAKPSPGIAASTPGAERRPKMKCATIILRAEANRKMQGSSFIGPHSISSLPFVLFAFSCGH